MSQKGPLHTLTPADRGLKSKHLVPSAVSSQVEHAVPSSVFEALSLGHVMTCVHRT